MQPLSTSCRHPLRHRGRTLLGLFLALVFASTVPVMVLAQKPDAGVKKGGATSSGKRRLPSENELKELVRKTLLDIDKGLETKEFSQLHASLAPTWRKQISKDQLSLMFAKQLDDDQRTDYAASNETVFDPAPAFDSKGLLVLSGHIPSLPQSIVFRLKFFNEGGYKPFGLAVRVQEARKAPSRLPLPNEKEESLPLGKAAAAAEAAFAAGGGPAAPGASPAPAVPGATPPGYVSPFAAPAASSPSPAGTPAASPAPSPAGSPR